MGVWFKEFFKCSFGKGMDVIEYFREGVGEGAIVSWCCVDAKIGEGTQDFNFWRLLAFVRIVFWVGFFFWVGGRGRCWGFSFEWFVSFGREVFTLTVNVVCEIITFKRILFLRCNGDGRVSKSTPSTLLLRSKSPNSSCRISLERHWCDIPQPWHVVVQWNNAPPTK